MVTIDDIVSIKDAEQFEEIALELFGYQSQSVEPYRRYLELIGVDRDSVRSWCDIPYLPISLFKSHKILSGSEHEHIFTSSGTSSMVQSSHYVKDLSIYERSFTESFRLFCGDPSQVQIFALLPGYLEREGSSLIYMIKSLIEQSGRGGFYLYDYDRLAYDLEHRDPERKTMLFGVTFALLDMAESGSITLSRGDIVMETGGMKGRRREIPRQELHQILTSSYGVDGIASEYGMCECLSQAYSLSDGIFETPPWMRISIRDTQNPFAKATRRGAVNITDLANIHSCSFIQSDDIATLLPDGRFKIEGRLAGSDIRGCNMLIEN